jgi:hypothetical protein
MFLMKIIKLPKMRVGWRLIHPLHLYRFNPKKRRSRSLLNQMTTGRKLSKHSRVHPTKVGWNPQM